MLRGTEPEKGCWSVPGGTCEPGESYADTAARETLEETGLHVSIDRELWIAMIPVGDDRVFESHDFAATVTHGKLAPGDDADDVRWFSEAELNTIPVTNDLIGYLRRANVFAPQ